MIDSITVEVIRHRLLSAAAEMATNLCRTSYNTVVYEIHDYGIGIHDANGDVIADTPGIAVFTGGNDFGIKKTIEFLGRENLRHGDVVLLNYPYWSCAHTLDALVLAPIHAGEELVAFASCRIHLLDLKQKDAGYVLDSTDMYQEGIFFPAVKLYREGAIVDDIFNIVRFNSRMPDHTIGDLQAQCSAVKTGERRVRAIIDRYGVETFRQASAEIIAHGERLARSRLAELPRGTWSAHDYVDYDGVDLDRMIKMACTVTVTDDEMIVDWSDSETDVRGPINLPEGLTLAATQLIFKALTTPDTTVTAGDFAPLRVITKPGSVFHAVPPMPTFTLWPGLLCGEVMLKALAQGMPDRVPASSGGDVCDIMALGIHPDTGRPWLEATNEGVGFGAHAEGDGEDGIMHLTEPGCRNNPVEVLETKAPLLIDHYRFRPDTGGPGEHRGGVGVSRGYRFLADASAISIVYKTKTKPWAIGEGKEGDNNHVVLRPGTEDESVIGGQYSQMKKGETLHNNTGGGGGWGNPFHRDAEMVRQDVIDGFVSLEKAQEDYGVVIDARTLEVDHDETKRIREETLVTG